MGVPFPDEDAGDNHGAGIEGHIHEEAFFGNVLDFGGISFILDFETDNEWGPAVQHEEEDFNLNNVFKVAGTIWLIVLVISLVGLTYNL